MRKVIVTVVLGFVSALATPSFAQFGARAKVSFAADRLMGVYIIRGEGVEQESGVPAKEPHSRFS